jgi:hypothetical protein
MTRLSVVGTEPVAQPVSSPMLAALDQLEQAARDRGVLYVDVVLQLALARHLVAVVERITLGTEPTVAQVHAIRELRLVTTELRCLVLEHTRRR